jgi:hypothetical protein
MTTPVNDRDGGLSLYNPDGAPPSSDCVASGDDQDADGFTVAQGDCNDCSKQVNPAAFDDPSNAVDEDCDGTAATELVSCDDGLAIGDNDAFRAAAAIGLCARTTESDKTWGVISARWVRPNGSGQLGSQLQPFGTLGARTGSSMLAISSGVARSPGQSGYTPGDDEFATEDTDPPSGVDVGRASVCNGDAETEWAGMRDGVALELRVRVPSNALGYRFVSNFFTREYPVYLCSTYNDFFVVLQEPRPTGAADANVLFDGDGNKVSVNNSLFQVCDPSQIDSMVRSRMSSVPTCPLGTGQLANTGYTTSTRFTFDIWTGVRESQEVPGSGATGWLQTEVPVHGGDVITIRFALWDAGDPILDSLALIDSFEWLLEDPGEASTAPVLQ